MNMRKLQELFYKIGRIVNFVMLGVYGLLVIIETIRTIVDAVNGNNFGDNIGAAIGYTIAAGFAVALIFLDKKYAEDALKAKNDALTPVIILMIFGLFVAFWCYVVGGVFGIIAASQENENKETKQVEEKKEEKAE